MNKRIDISEMAALSEFSQQFAKECAPDAWIYLLGELGTGKTTFSKEFLRAKGYQKPVTSPTYALMNDYDTPTGAVVHCDLYRLSDPEELYEIGLIDLASPTIKLVEWATKGEGVLPPPDYTLTFLLVSRSARYVNVTKHH